MTVSPSDPAPFRLSRSSSAMASFEVITCRSTWSCAAKASGGDQGACRRGQNSSVTFLASAVKDVFRQPLLQIQIVGEPAKQ